eukprot:579258-Pleurochrysis_carterae.AAC.1
MVENPADCGDPDGEAWWPRFSAHAPLWVYPPMAAALRDLGAAQTTCAQCAWGSHARKLTTLAFAGSMAEHAEPLREARCAHREHGHPQVAYGRDEWGRARAGAAAAYPPGMNVALARMLLSAGAAAAQARRAATGGNISGGRVADGPGLSASIRAAIEAARVRPP